MRNSESFETIESQILDSATLVSRNDEGDDGDESLERDVVDIDFEDDGILIMPPDFEEKSDHDSSLSLPESVPSTVGSVTEANNREAQGDNKGRGQGIEHEDETEDTRIENELSEENRHRLSSSELVYARSGITWIGYMCFVAMLFIHFLTFYTKGADITQSANSCSQISYNEALSKVGVLENQVRDLEAVQKENEELRKRNAHLDDVIQSMEEIQRSITDKALAKIDVWEKKRRDLEGVQKENEELRKRNAHLDDVIQSMQKVQRSNDSLRTKNKILKEQLESEDYFRCEKEKNFTEVMKEVTRLMDGVNKKVRDAQVTREEKCMQSLASLSEERDRLLRKTRRLQGQVKKMRKKLDREDENTKEAKRNAKESFRWENTDETKGPIIENCWLQVGLGECSKGAKISLHEGTQKVTESLWNAKNTFSTTLRELKEGLKDSASSLLSRKHDNGTNHDKASRKHYEKVDEEYGDYYDKFQDDIMEFVSNSVESLKKNERIVSIGNTAKSVLTGVVFAAAASLIVSSTFVGGIFGEDGEESNT
ncbi:hypothetical protein FisN_1Lh487 [Fistulifera solaris]|uniref:Uncharacterized protein n=1 Tax=Fistulifera solaris TaxID=1519565 RepID=A0A1Z5K1J1_FISSO|nr:hypothetical protein FisN_1Lh487 [Fistulifera solaris]|eukprot:GAX20032.1 hypothetical protein FisN_1Lh487 [Fistulifera solaris]